MNLHINKEQFDVLMNSKLIGKFIIGSKLYGIDNDNSDTDYLIIYQPFKNQIFSAFTNHHQFQYKDVDYNIDYNFVDVITFVRNLTKGDSTINYELLYSDDFAKSKLGFLSEIKDKFKTYTIKIRMKIKFYLVKLHKKILFQIIEQCDSITYKEGNIHAVTLCEDKEAYIYSLSNPQFYTPEDMGVDTKIVLYLRGCDKVRDLDIIERVFTTDEERDEFYNLLIKKFKEISNKNEL